MQNTGKLIPRDVSNGTRKKVIEYSVLGSMPSVLPFENLVMVHILVLKVFFQIT